MRYHSIVVDQMPEEFDVTAITDDQEIMAINTRSLPILWTSVSYKVSVVQMIKMIEFCEAGPS